MCSRSDGRKTKRQSLRRQVTRFFPPSLPPYPPLPSKSLPSSGATRLMLCTFTDSENTRCKTNCSSVSDRSWRRSSPINRFSHGYLGSWVREGKGEMERRGVSLERWRFACAAETDKAMKGPVLKNSVLAGGRKGGGGRRERGRDRNEDGAHDRGQAGAEAT